MKAGDPGTQWLIVCTCGGRTRTTSQVAADAAVIVHRQEASPTAQHSVAYSRFQGHSRSALAIESQALIVRGQRE
jgi:hypothetical protein